MYVHETSTGKFEEVGDCIVHRRNGQRDVTWPGHIVNTWSAAQLAEIGVHEVVPAAPVPGIPLKGRTFKRVEGRVHEVLVYDMSKEALMSFAAGKRYARETSGISVRGVRVATDRESIAMINASYSMALRDPKWSTMWKAGSVFIPIDAPAMLAIAVAAMTHIERSFRIEADVVAAIDAGTITTFEQIEEAFA